MTIRMIGAAALVAASASAVSAQSVRPERPYRGIFGGGYGNTEQLLMLNASGSGGYDTDVLAGGTNASPASTPVNTAGRQEASQYGQFGGSLEYTLNRKRVGFGATASTSQRTYPSLGLLGTYAGGLNGWFQLKKRTRVVVNESSSYQPFLNYALFPVPVVPGDEGVAPDVTPNFQSGIARRTQLHHSVSASLTQDLTSRASLSFSSGADKTDSSGAGPKLTSTSVNGRLSYRVAKGLGFHAGYGYQEGRYGGEAAQTTRAPVFHNIDIGVDYNRPLSFSRKTTLSFGTGSAAVQDQGRTQYRATGNANLTYELNRTWSATAAFNRDAQFVQNLRAPVFGDSLTAGVHGLINRRLNANLSAGGSRGTVGVTSAGSGYEGYFGTATLIYGLSRHLGLSATYSYFHYSFDRAVDLTSATQPDMTRQSVQAGLNLKLPLMSRARRPDAAR